MKAAEGKEHCESGRRGRPTTGSSVRGTSCRRRQAAAPQAARTPELARGLCLGGGSPLGTARHGAPQAADKGGRRAGGRDGQALPTRLQGPGQPGQGRFCPWLGCVSYKLSESKTEKKETTKDILFCNFRVDMLLKYKKTRLRSHKGND